VGTIVDATLQGMYLVDVPQGIVDHATAEKVDVQASGQGERGRLTLEEGKNLRDLETAIANIGGEYRKLQSEIRKARIDIEYVGLLGQQDELRLAFQKLDGIVRPRSRRLPVIVNCLTR